MPGLRIEPRTSGTTASVHSEEGMCYINLSSEWSGADWGKVYYSGPRGTGFDPRPGLFGPNH